MKHMYIQHFIMGVDWPEIGCLMEVSAMFYICTYCVFPWWGREVHHDIQYADLGFCLPEVSLYRNSHGSLCASLITTNVSSEGILTAYTSLVYDLVRCTRLVYAFKFPSLEITSIKVVHCEPCEFRNKLTSGRKTLKPRIPWSIFTLPLYTKLLYQWDPLGT